MISDPKYLVRELNWLTLSSMILQDHVKPSIKKSTKVLNRSIVKHRRKGSIETDNRKSINNLTQYVQSSRLRTRRKSCECSDCTGSKTSMKQKSNANTVVMISMLRKAMLANIIISTMQPGKHHRISKYIGGGGLANLRRDSFDTPTEEEYVSLKNSSHHVASRRVSKHLAPIIPKTPKFAILEASKSQMRSFDNFKKLSLPSLMTFSSSDVLIKRPPYKKNSIKCVVSPNITPTSTSIYKSQNDSVRLMINKYTKRLKTSTN